MVPKARIMADANDGGGAANNGYAKPLFVKRSETNFVKPNFVTPPFVSKANQNS